MKSHIVWTSIKMALVLLSWETLAVNKCDVDGKIVYKNSPCPPHAKERAFEGTVSSVNSAGLRSEVENKKIAMEEQQKAKQRSEVTTLRLITHDKYANKMDQNAAKLELIRRGEWKESDEMSELKREVRKAKEMAEDAKSDDSFAETMSLIRH